MTFYDIDGTPYGPKEYAADKMVVMQAEAIGAYVPYHVKRRVSDYEMGCNPFYTEYVPKKNILDGPLGRLVTVFGLFAIGIVVGAIVSIIENGTLVGEFFGNIFPFLLPGIYIVILIFISIKNL